ncbi:Creatinine amidohydrolase/Fe(II)-dependent formamide hydrolase involved in riboflavin and F420 biosynthesis [Halanaeroarchaeum sp. HSR-CO]|uniref:creatininase family protein n=1 Tax=Halanaeroarchaeum sp. HSR-CO TaxID=2866382 RepID=UPI00217D5C06|nr:creatininase family protein [Halanaeroarchaeum sp. HSR-CO]UWG47113.1 Creatinine amidohydrolase/Fe(II)-dependent formamide hydrolase involved in riboflavin and F420 biosynthesis [Halanaeroarchaeum sp. HSR-CO]
MRLADVPWTDADAADVDVVLLPVGSTEQHGPHAPLGTDHRSAEAVAEVAADATELEAVVAPTIPVGISEEHRQFTGTTWVSPDTFRAYVRETIESLFGHGWNRVVIVNGHGGNSAAIEEVAARLTRNNDALVAPFTWFDAVDVDVPMGHAGPLETSFLLAAFPDLVHEDRFESAAGGAADRWGDWVGGTNLAPDSVQFAENGVVGDPRAASTAIGETLEQQASDALVSVMEAVLERDVTTPAHR